MQLHIAKMACGGCVETVTKAIAGVDPGARVSADLGTRTVDVETSAAQDRIEQALAAAGYPARAG